jgi:hypothetical protein
MENPYEKKKGYKGDESASYLGYKQYGPMTELQAKYEEYRQLRKKQNQGGQAIKSFLNWLTDEPEGEKKGGGFRFLDKIGGH